MNQPYRIAGIDIHKKMLAVVVTEIAAGGELTFERRKFGTLDSDLKELSQWLAEREVKVVVMESTAQYWRSVWFQLEGQWDPTLRWDRRVENLPASGCKLRIRQRRQNLKSECFEFANHSGDAFTAVFGVKSRTTLLVTNPVMEDFPN
jgi:hypothetical protein